MLSFSFSSTQHKILSIFSLLIIIALIPLSVYLVKQQQEIRSRAAEEDKSVFFGHSKVNPVPLNFGSVSKSQTESVKYLTIEYVSSSSATPKKDSSQSSVTPLGKIAKEKSVSLVLSPETFTATVGATLDAKLTLSAGSNNITGIDVTVKYDKGIVEVVNLQPSSEFDNQLVNKVDNSLGTLRYSAVNVTKTNLTGDINIGTITFKAKREGTSNVAFENIQITALGSTQGLITANNTTLKYTVIPSSKNYSLSLKQPIKGATIAFSEENFSLKQGEQRAVTVTLEINPGTLREGSYSNELILSIDQTNYSIPLSFNYSVPLLNKLGMGGKASVTETPTDLTKEKGKPEYTKGEVLVKFKGGGLQLQRKDISAKAVDLDTEQVKVEEINEETLPLSLRELNQKYQIKEIDKVFKGFSTPQQEINEIKEKISAKEIQERQINEEELKQIDLSKIYKLSFDEKTPIEPIIQELSQNPEVEYAEPNYIYRTQLVPNDPYYQDSYPNGVSNRDSNWYPPYDYQWNLKKISMEQAWDEASNSAQVVVAVVDTGVDYTHPEFGGCTLEQVNQNLCPKVVPGYDFINEDSDPRDDNGHGTHVAGIIASATNNNQGIAGISPQASNIKIMPIKALGRNGAGYLDDLAEATLEAARRGARVINMSYGGGFFMIESETEREALEAAYNMGTVLVAAAGNSRTRVEYGFWPANHPRVIAVGATRYDDRLAGYSNFGEKVEVVAPGSSILSLNASDPENPGSYLNASSFLVGSEFLVMSGTSMAAPHVAGLAALLLQKNSTLNADRIKDIIASSAVDYGEPGFDDWFGYGRIDATVALSQASTLPSPPRARILNFLRYNVSIEKGPFEIRGTASGDNFERFVIEWKNVRETSNWLSVGVNLVNGASSPIIDATLGTWTPPISLQPGEYDIRLKVFAGGKVAFATATVNYDSSIKALIEVPCSWPGERSTPVVTDVNNDGRQEIITVCGGNLYVYSSTGSLLFTKTAWTLPAVGEIDASYPGKEIVVIEDQHMDASSRRARIMAWRGDGTPVPGQWPRVVDDAFLSHLVIADLDGDRIDDVVGFEVDISTNWRTQIGGRVIALKSDGRDLPGFTPFNLPRFPSEGTSFDFANFYMVGDVDGDNYKEIISREVDVLSVFNSRGRLIWQGNEPVGPAVVGDLDGDNVMEIIAVLGDGNVKIYNWDGMTFVSREIYQLPAASQRNKIRKLQLTDFDLDGRPEIVLEVHFITPEESSSEKGFFKYVVIDSQGRIITGFPGAPGVSFFPPPSPGSGDSPPWNESPFLREYPFKFHTWEEFIPTNVVFGKTSAGQKIMAYEAVTWFDRGYNNENTFLEAFTYDGRELRRYPGFPKKIRNHRAICGWTCSTTYLTPVVADLDNNGRSEVIASVSGARIGEFGFAIYIFELNDLVTDQDWPQYLHNEGHTGTYRQQAATRINPLSISLKIPGIGDNRNENKNPFRRERGVTVSVLDTTRRVIKSIYGSVIFDGKAYAGTIYLGNLTQGFYHFQAKVDNSLSTLTNPSPFNFTDNTLIPTQSATLIMGDVNNDNMINISDFGQLRQCFSKNTSSPEWNTCQASDFNDDGRISGVDYSRLLTNFLRRGE